jgi:RNA polymerase sigma factor (sigma-70 family)
MPSSTPVRARSPLRGDEGELFRRHHRRLLALVARDVSARPQVIEDACAYAWLEFVDRQPERISVIGWLRIVARHEAIRLVQYDRRLVDVGGECPEQSVADRRSSGQEACDALALLAALPPRRRAVLTLQVSGHSYREIAAELGMSQRTVERQLLRARAAVRQASHEALAA